MLSNYRGPLCTMKVVQFDPITHKKNSLTWNRMVNLLFVGFTWMPDGVQLKTDDGLILFSDKCVRFIRYV